MKDELLCTRDESYEDVGTISTTEAEGVETFHPKHGKQNGFELVMNRQWFTGTDAGKVRQRPQ